MRRVKQINTKIQDPSKTAIKHTNTAINPILENLQNDSEIGEDISVVLLVDRDGSDVAIVVELDGG